MIFDSVGIYGLSEEIETGILAGMVLGEPLLLIGRHGSAKTALVNAIGSALRERTRKKYPNNPGIWFNYQIYDASKINWEDLIGIPNPKALQEGRIEFIDSPLTVWNKQMIGFDEFNRQLPERQNNIFELVRSRRCVGIPTRAVWIMNAMNPNSYAGSEELDEALVDRHLFFFNFDDFTDMPEEVRLKIISMMGGDDGPALKKFTKSYQDFTVLPDQINETLAQAGANIWNYLRKGAAEYQKIEQEHGGTIQKILERVIFSITATTEMENSKVFISGRRAGMLYRGLLALLATYRVLGKERSIEDALRTTIRLGLPVGIIQYEVPPDQLWNLITAAISSAVNTLNTDLTSVLTIQDILTTTSPFELYQKLTQKIGKLSENDRNHTVKELISQIRSLSNDDQSHIFSRGLTISTALLLALPEIPELNPDITQAIAAKLDTPLQKDSHLSFKDIVVGTASIEVTSSTNPEAEHLSTTLIINSRGVSLKLNHNALYDDVFKRLVPLQDTNKKLHSVLTAELISTLLAHTNRAKIISHMNDICYQALHMEKKDEA